MRCKCERRACHLEGALEEDGMMELGLWDLRTEREIREDVRNRVMQRVIRRPVGMVVVVGVLEP